MATPVARGPAHPGPGPGGRSSPEGEVLGQREGGAAPGGARAEEQPVALRGRDPNRPDLAQLSDPLERAGVVDPGERSAGREDARKHEQRLGEVETLRRAAEGPGDDVVPGSSDRRARRATG